jgi:pimeloyl-ACP methyl ester carboxylesterase
MNEPEYFARSADGTGLVVRESGQGRPIVVVHGGMGAAAHWDPVSELLAPSWRILGLERRLYGRSGPPQSPHSMAHEAEDVVAVLAAVGEPAIVVGHSSGAVATLEAALLRPANLAGLVLYEPPVPAGIPLGGDHQARAEAALAAGDADTALYIFFHDIVGFGDDLIDPMRSPKWRAGWEYMQTVLPAQLEDNRAIRALPVGVDRYAAITVPALLLRGTQSPKHLHDRLAALAAALPHNSVVDLPGEGHNANMSSPQLVADAIDAFARKVLG